ncbi:hypothetical protein ACH4VR_36990 [Streptomyces sp. NPDC020883]
MAGRDGQSVTDDEKTPAVEPVEDKLVDEVARRLMGMEITSKAAGR